jgi:hypothetical protein
MHFRSGCFALLLSSLAGHAADAPQPAAATPAVSCLARCEKAESACSTQVRRARQDCSKKAATAGRDPMSMRRDYSTYFCGYFGSPSRCSRDPLARDCSSRFSRRHGLCVDAIQDNIAAQRYDCYLNERDAQTFCRDELRDCKETCSSPGREFPERK